MGMTKTLGGDRIGSGNKMKVELHGYERSTHNLGYLWRSTMAAGTLVPCISEVALPGDTFDINLDLEIMTHPTVGPLFGSYKSQTDVYIAPIRLYQALLHNNALGIGMNMANVKLPQLRLYVDPTKPLPFSDPDNWQINPSCVLSYLGIRGIGTVDPAEVGLQERLMNAIPLLMLWDTYKNYYANKQEEIGMVVHTPNDALVETVTAITVNGSDLASAPGNITGYNPVTVAFTGADPIASQIILNTSAGSGSLSYFAQYTNTVGGVQNYVWRYGVTGPVIVFSWEYVELPNNVPGIVSFPLETLDAMRNEILAAALTPTAFIVNDNLTVGDPYSLLLGQGPGGGLHYLGSQEGLPIKTYNSDLFNNWLSTEWLDGAGGINEISAVDVSGGLLKMDALNLAKKVYEYMNRVAVSGGSYDDWQDAVWAHKRYTQCTTPMYQGGLIKELVFQEVVSNAQSGGIAEATQPLGTLAGKGIMAKKKKGGRISIKVDEPSWILALTSLTPRIDYSQGNKWDTGLSTLDDLHKPALDQIGFQELITEQMHWATTAKNLGDPTWVQKSAGKQPAWLNYMTNVNQTRGNFAIQGAGVGEMFMTLNRKYELEADSGEGAQIADLTTYIDPAKFNNIFAQTSLDSQNFWVQIAVDMTVRRKISAKLMPNV